MQIVATQLRVGTVIVFNGNLCRAISVTHLTPGNWRGMVHVKVRRLSDGTQYEHRYRSEDMVEKASMDTRTMEYLYQDDSGYTFMDSESYEQVTLSKDMVGDSIDYMLPNVAVQVMLHDERPVGLELPTTVVLKVVETPPGLRGATASSSSKPATLETGLVVQVPPHIEVGQPIRVDTRTGAYLERA